MADLQSHQTQIEGLSTAIRNFVISRVRNPSAAEDVSQEVLLRISRNISALVKRDRLDAWAFQIARNAIADYFRSARATEEFHEELHGKDGEGPDPVLAEEEDAMRTELAAYIRSEVELLPPIYREALLLTEYEGVSQTDLARNLGLALSTIKSRVQRGRGLLKSRMEQCCLWTTDRYGAVIDVTPKTGSDQCDGCKESC